MSLHRPERLVWDLDWNLLRSFVVIAEVKSITRAAERLNLKQPSVSNALRRLEDRIGQRLVERAGGEILSMEQENGALFRVVLPVMAEATKP